MSDNVIEFPKIRVDSPAESPEELQRRIVEYKEEYANEIAEFIWRQAIGELSRAGCDFTDMKKYFPSMMLVLESIRSLHLQTQGIEHNLQQFAEDAITIEDLDDFEEKMVDTEDELD